MRIKKPLPKVPAQMVDADARRFALELQHRFPAWGKLPPEVSRNPYHAVASVALHPGILAETEMCASECRAFAGCFKRYPDQVIEALASVRGAARQQDDERRKQLEKDGATQAGRVRQFLTGNLYVARRDGKHFPVATAKRSDKIVRTETLTDGELAACIGHDGFTVTTESVKKFRQSLTNGKR